MDIHFKSLDEFLRLGLTPSNAFGMPDFLLLNAHKAEEIVCAVSEGAEVGMAFGVKGGALLAPWSAPYLSVFSHEKMDEYTEAERKRKYVEFGESLREKLTGKDFKLVFPPDIYNASERAVMDGFMRKEQNEAVVDTSFYIELKDSAGEDGWNKSARRALRKGRNACLEAYITDKPEECYELIARHHKDLGYNMAMTCRQVLDTSAVIPVDFWIVAAVKADGAKVPVAAMYCYRVRPDIVQVIASGDTPEGRVTGAPIFMERAIIDYYRMLLVDREKHRGAILDHGPTSVGGVQNEGLAAFKSSFGCKVTPKTTIIPSR